MKNTIAIIIFFGGMLPFVSCQLKSSTPVVPDTSQRDSLQRVIDQKDNEINDILNTFNDIQEGFRIISAAEGKVQVLKDGESTNKSEQIRESIRYISQTMQHNRDLIAKLRQQAREGSVHSEQLRATIENLMLELQEKDARLKELQESLQEKDIHIAELDQTVSDLSSDIKSLREESESKSQMISNQDRQLNTAWYVFGTKKELQTQNIYEKGRVLQSNFNKNYFTKIDIRVDKEIKLYSKSARLLTSHPSSSYTLTQDANKQYILRISNPQVFWSTSKYLVVLVK